MNKPDQSKWIRLVLEDVEGDSYFSYTDGLGVRLEGPFGSFRLMKLEDFFPERPMLVRYSEKMDECILAVANAEPRKHDTADGPKPIPLAVYLDVLTDRKSPVALRLFEDLVTNYLTRLAESDLNFQIVFYHHETEDAKPFSLPFNIRVTDDKASGIITSLQNTNWYKNNIEVDQFGMNIRNYHFYPSDEEIDILVLSIEHFGYFAGNDYFIRKTKPRLLILLLPDGQHPEDFPYVLDNFLYVHSGRKVHNLTCMYLVGSRLEDQQSFFKEFMLSLIHDFPLHEALHWVLSRNKEGTVSARLFASPVSNHGLRMTDAVDSFKAKVLDYSKTINPGNLGAFFKKFSPNESDVAGAISNVIPGNLVGLNYYFNRVNENDVRFIGESTGLVPMAQAKQEFHNMEPQFKQIQTGMQSIVNDKKSYSIIRERQERKVDITLDKWGSFLLYQPFYKNATLVAGAQYRLNVSIGLHADNSLMAGDVPAIDPLFPDPENEKGHELDIVVYPKDFTLLSASCQTVYLPLLGGTDITRFIIKAPVEKNEASLRVGIFYKNNLLQAFILTAVVETEARYTNENMVKVELDLSTSQKFTNIDSLNPRGLYLGVNDNGSGTHSIFFKKENIAEEIDGLELELIKKAQEKFSELLTQASFEGKTQKYSPAAKPGDPVSESFFDDVRAFARFGKEYYSKIFLSNQELKDKLREFRQSRDQCITIGRHQPNFSFPWPMLYDYPLDTPKAGEPEHPVCMGKKLDAQKYKKSIRDDGKGCRHNPDLYTYCIDGFWGIRHRIEQILSKKTPADTKDSINITNGSFSYCDNITDPFAIDLDNTLEKEYNATRITHEPDDDLLKKLWDAKSRPAALVVFGHMQTLIEDHEPKFPRIITFPKASWQGNPADIPKSKWIYHEILSEKIEESDWKDDPLPVIFLVNCSTAGITVGSLNSIVYDFHSAGATAVIGTECNITSDLGARFLKEVLEEMYKNGVELGEAIQKFNKRLFESGVPLAFVFTCFGNNNLRFK